MFATVHLNNCPHCAAGTGPCAGDTSPEAAPRHALTACSAGHVLTVRCACRRYLFKDLIKFCRNPERGTFDKKGKVRTRLREGRGGERRGGRGSVAFGVAWPKDLG